MITKTTALPTEGPPLSKGMSPPQVIVDKTGKFNKLQRAFQQQLLGLANDFYKTYHEPLVLTDTVRTQAEQAQAHREKPTLALPAGHPNAMHPKGLAADVELGQSRMITPEMLAKNGLHLPALSKGETWHIEPVCQPGNLPAYSSRSYPRSPSFSRAELLHLSTQRASKSYPRSRKSEHLSPLQPKDLADQGVFADRPRLLQAAMEIESIFLEQLLGQMRRAMVDPLSPSHRKLQGYLSMADQQLARSLAASGGLGLAERIVEDLALSHPRMENRHEFPGKTGPPTEDTLV